MLFQSIAHRYNRFRELGVNSSIKIINNKARNKLFYIRWKNQAIEQAAQHIWQAIARKHGRNESFVEYWHQTSSKSLPSLLNSSHDFLIAQANEYIRNQFDILGSGSQTFIQLPWHEDIRLKVHNPHADYQFNAQSFYKDIKIKTGTVDIIKDIKVPWELSRCQHLPILGQAYDITHDEQYAQAFIVHVESWLDNNPYLLGINWLCPMEVAIRALNWIWAWHYFKQSSDIPPDFWQRFTCSLYDHMHYLENNWEIFDTKTSNHYLSDLLGYLYLCWFFQDLPGINGKRDWCIKELIKEFERQVFVQGTDYESTTSYHCLVTEIFDHVALLCAAMNISLPKEFHEKLNRMHEFIEWCKVNDNAMVKIGDDDSGRVMKISPYSSVLPEPIEGSTGTKHFPSFGLSILKKNNWHITLRHHAYTKIQPSAHFHNDALSITLAINGIPIIIDPGSYLYTASAYWRNYFRSVNVHNTFYIQGHEPVPFDERLFALNIPENSIAQNGLDSFHNLYSRFDIKMQRNLDWSNEKLTITDTWTQTSNDLNLGWNFTLHPAIEITWNDHRWTLSLHDKPLVVLESMLDFQPHETWISPEYGVKVKSLSFKANYSARLGNESKIVFIKL